MIQIKKRIDVVDGDCFIYEFHYFFNRKDSGSFFIAFNKELDIYDQDECIEVAVEVGALDSSYADNIDYIEELDFLEARQMGVIPETVYSI